jgi:hypothetical protein
MGEVSDTYWTMVFLKYGQIRRTNVFFFKYVTGYTWDVSCDTILRDMASVGGDTHMFLKVKQLVSSSTIFLAD